jgi:conjugative transfer signal peptidase TraF
MSVARTSRVFEPDDNGGRKLGTTREKAGRAHRSVYVKAALVGLAIGAVLATIVHPLRPRLLWNASASAPLGFYLITPGATVEVGDMVAARAPEGARQLAARRGYLSSGVPLVKRVAATQGSQACASGAHILVDGRVAVRREKRDSKGRLMPWWQGCRRLRPGEVLLLNRVKASFDSRYFGPIEHSAIIGKAVLIWPR